MVKKRRLRSCRVNSTPDALVTCSIARRGSTRSGAPETRKDVFGALGASLEQLKKVIAEGKQVRLVVLGLLARDQQGPGLEVDVAPAEPSGLGSP